MKLFKNKVGRPSNKTLRKRKIFYISLISLIVILIGGSILVLNNTLNTNKIKGLSRPSKVKTPTFEIIGVDTDLKIGDKTIKKGTYLETDEIEDDLVIVSENKKVGFNSRFPSSIYSGFWKNYFTLSVGAYDENDNLIGNLNKTKITKSDILYNFTITKDVKYIKAQVFISIISGLEKEPLYEDIIYVTTKSETKDVNVSFYDSNMIKANSKGIYEVSKYDDYTSYAVIDNPGNQTLYYRWFTYTNFNNNKPSYNSMRSDYCVASSDSTIIVEKGLGLGVKSNYKERMGTVRVYLTKEQCKNDNNANDNSIVKESFVKYKYNEKATSELYDFKLTSEDSDITIKNTKTLDISNKIKKNNSKTLKTDDGLTYMVTNSGKSITFNVNIPKNVYTAEGINKQYMSFVTYDKDGNAIKNYIQEISESTKTYSYTFIINDNVKKIALQIYVKNSLNDKTVIITNKYIKTNISDIDITFKDKNNYGTDSDGIYLVPKTGNYTPVVTITNNKGGTIYYRWFTYKGLDAKTLNWNKDSCKTMTGNTYTKDNLETLYIDLSSNNFKNRSGKLKLYSNKTSCTNDTKGTSTSNLLGYAVVNYKYKSGATTIKNTDVTKTTIKTTTKTTNNSKKVTITLDDKNGNTKSSNNTVYVTKFGKYYVKATIKQSGTSKLYYRWDTFNGLDANAESHNYADKNNKCKSFNKSSITISNLESLDFWSESNPRSGRLSVYDNESSCLNDTKNSGKTSIATAVINYDLKDTATNKSEFKFITNYISGNAKKSDIERDIGRQFSQGCYEYSFAYGVYIMKNGDKNYTLPVKDKTSCGLLRSQSYYGANSWSHWNNYSAKSSSDEANISKGIYNEIKTKIDSQIPLVLSVDNSYYANKGSRGSGEHYVLVVGYKNATINNYSDLKESIWILDPAPLKQDPTKVEEMRDGALSEFGYHVGSPKYNPKPYLSTWTNISNAKLPSGGLPNCK